ncbi:MAG: potassium channel family protein [Hyphomicrobiales bacterium]|nr:potassium channel family protein [Hyphomicrobiales bacterium]
MIALTVLIHVAGIYGLLGYLRQGGALIADNRRHLDVIKVLIVTVLGIFFLHTVQIWCWAVLYRWLGQFETLERALYFSTVTFTTLGYGDVTLERRWQLLSSLEAANGIILFGVSTALVFAVLRTFLRTAAIVPKE